MKRAVRRRNVVSAAAVTAAAIALAVGLLTAVMSPSAASAGSGTERFYVSEIWHSFTGTAGMGKAGDVYAFQSTLKTTAGKKAGTLNGYGLNLRQPFVAWHVTAILSKGTLVLASVQNMQAQRRLLVITGGTGRYLGARGTVALTAAGSRGELATLTLLP